MAICCALIKHGYSNFSLIILEYCLVAELLIREKHYQKTLKPEYNIAKDPVAPFSGRKHSDASKTKISDGKTGENNPFFGKNHSDESKIIMAEAKKGEKNSMYGKNHTEETKTIMSDAKKGKPRPEGAGSPSQAIEVFDNKNNQTTSYDSMHEAGRALDIRWTAIKDYFANNQQKPYKGRYTFKKI